MFTIFWAADYKVRLFLDLEGYLGKRALRVAIEFFGIWDLMRDLMNPVSGMGPNNFPSYWCTHGLSIAIKILQGRCSYSFLKRTFEKLRRLESKHQYASMFQHKEVFIPNPGNGP
jgi:hypothetical protein